LRKPPVNEFVFLIIVDLAIKYCEAKALLLREKGWDEG
jgi:hypothetical protein